MNRNQKIAIGCGSAGCLGLLVLAVGLGVFFYLTGRAGRNTNYNYNYNSNRATITNRNENANTNRATTNENTPPPPTSSTSMSDDDKHKLYQAAATTSDNELMHKVWKKLGLMDANDVPNDNYVEFAKDHIAWLFKNTDFMQEVNTPEKARAYVNAHIDE